MSTIGMGLMERPLIFMGKHRTEPKGEFPELARIAREYAGSLTLQQINLRTGMNRQSIANLLNGSSVGPAMLVAFAAGLKRPVNPLREAMNLPVILPDPTALIDDDESPSVSVVAERMGVSLDTLLVQSLNPAVMSGVKLVLEREIPAVMIERWEENNARYEGMMDGLRRSGAVKKRAKPAQIRAAKSRTTPE
jgi:transcriptional regulator with XRE-family HTH domain